MKTPHTIKLYIGDSKATFNPETGKHETETVETKNYNCLVNFMTKAKQFEEYGTREKEIIIVRFNSDVPAFDKAVFEGSPYRIIEQSFVKHKRSFRLEKVVE